MTARLLMLCALLSLTACTPSDDGLALQADYLQRLGNVLDSPSAEAFDLTHAGIYRMPPRRERLLEVPELRIGLLDLLIDVRRCADLQQLISQRNSLLGKQLMASSRLAYEGDLLRALDSCIARLDGSDDADLRTRLSDLATQKRAQLPAVFWNAFNGSNEVERYLRFSAQALPATPGEDGAALDALEQLAGLAQRLPEQLPPPAEQLEPLFQALHASAQGGELITSLASLRHTLDHGTALLRQRLANRPLCPQGLPTERGRILQNIFVKYYAGHLQPYLSQVHQRGERWQRAVQHLAAQDAPAATHDYLLRLAGTQDSLWQAFVTATGEHVSAWQDSLRSCGLAPGQAGWPAPQG
ncbi:Protein of unknown function [Pseudomonas cuatrocienegasensis]|uniref:DUF3080 domain-containing protein n=1 Tax=Pseudomonas cuatrocienegasensis TaxID=543360 RepID=A0ABY1B2C6_9PSED|nr:MULTISPECIES: DUF3080 domain-containing protein [Pseudomonas]OEC36357.1 hypothetical protein A7D25_04185 [Pseudomonas sp. 21C1]SEP74546.1 Protein of unknown function [Pseudomonas cuatrocienegasensis]